MDCSTAIISFLPLTSFCVTYKKERKAKRLTELRKSKANKDEVDRELARLDQDSKEEQKRVEVKFHLVSGLRCWCCCSCCCCWWLLLLFLLICCALLQNIRVVLIDVETPSSAENAERLPRKPVNRGLEERGIETFNKLPCPFCKA